MKYDITFDDGAINRLAIPADPSWLRTLIPSGVIGSYLLLDKDRPIYVGRSDTCLQSRLTHHELLGSASHVIWEICSSVRRAFHIEAFWYDRLKPKGLLNQVHPARPSGDSRPCPFCGIDEDLIGVALMPMVANVSSLRSIDAKNTNRGGRSSDLRSLKF